MGFFSNQFSNVVELEEYRDDLIFWKWKNREIKKGSKLIIRPGQDAIFMFNGAVEGIFEDDGSYDIESQIIPFLSTLKGFKFGFNSGMRAEVLFVNTKEFIVKWGTKQPINIPSQQMPGGMPIRALGTFSFKISDKMAVIEKIAGVKDQYSVADVKERVVSMLDSLLMSWIMKEGKDMFNLQMSNREIARGICEDLDFEMGKIGLEITNFNIEAFSYPEEIQKMINKNASYSMVGDVNRYQQIGMTDAMTSGKMNGAGGQMAANMMEMQMGMMMGQQMMNNMNNQQMMNNMNNQQMMNNMNNQQMMNNGQMQQQGGQSQGTAPKFCPECGAKTNGSKFCSECGTKLI